MAYELKPGSGSLFENARKQSDSHPDMTGSINVNGVECWFSGWWKDGKSGTQFLSVSIGKPKDQQPQASAPQRQAAPAQPVRRPGQRDMTPRAASQQMDSHGFDGPDDDIPW
jgi:hypothetical protein